MLKLIAWGVVLGLLLGAWASSPVAGAIVTGLIITVLALSAYFYYGQS